MDFISTKDAAAKWNVGIREIQLYCKKGRIPGAQKYGNTWMIPRSAAKPVKERLMGEFQYFNLGMVSINVKIPENDPNAVFSELPDEEHRKQYAAEMAYICGDFATAKACFSNTSDDSSMKFCAATISIVAAISEGDYKTYFNIAQWLKNDKKRHLSGSVSGNPEGDSTLQSRRKTGFAGFLPSDMPFTAAYVSMSVPDMVPEYIKKGNFEELPPESVNYSLYLYAKYLQVTKQYEQLLAVTKILLAVFRTPGKFSFPEIYFELLCATALYNLNRQDEMIPHVERAVAISLPYGFISPLAEVMNTLGGSVEMIIGRDYLPEELRRVVEQWGRTGLNWLNFHNRFTRDNITSVLTLREQHVAYALASGATYERAAKQLHCSVSSINKTATGIYQKLFIHSKNELKNYIL